jgi:hypothetical protein
MLGVDVSSRETPPPKDRSLRPCKKTQVAGNNRHADGACRLAGTDPAPIRSLQVAYNGTAPVTGRTEPEIAAGSTD